jgi:predicted MPP superfamily phosphohydrolase
LLVASSRTAAARRAATGRAPRIRRPPTTAPPIATRPRRRGAFLRNFVLYVVACWGVVGALVAPLLPGGWLTVAAAALLSFVPLAVFLRSRAAGRYPGAITRLLLFRGFLYVQLALPLLAAGALVGLLVGALAGAPARGGRVALLVVGAGALLLGVAGWVGSRRLRVRRLDARWPDLPAGLEGVRIAQLSDLHVGPQTSRRFLARVRRAVEGAHPDVVALTGDLIDDHAPDVAHLAAALGTLRAPLGVYAVPGNHDVYANWPAVAARLGQLPITLLVNDAATVERGGARLTILGVGDPAGRGTAAGPDPHAAALRVPPGAFTVALAHNPALWPSLAELGVRLTLSGHTHWGQFALPRRNWSLATPFLHDLAMGAHRTAASLLYIAPGTGFWGLPFRLGAWPEVTIITLGVGEETAIVEAGAGESA